MDKMRLKLFSIVSLIIVVVVLCIANISMSAGTTSPSYSFDLSIVPAQQASDAYQAKLLIRELASNKVVAAPTVLFRAGEGANTTAGQGSDDTNFQFSVAVSKSGETAEYDASVLYAKTVVSRSQGKISLKR
jgi:hypothetical protein